MEGQLKNCKAGQVRFRSQPIQQVEDQTIYGQADCTQVNYVSLGSKCTPSCRIDRITQLPDKLRKEITQKENYEDYVTFKKWVAKFKSDKKLEDQLCLGHLASNEIVDKEHDVLLDNWHVFKIVIAETMQISKEGV